MAHTITKVNLISFFDHLFSNIIYINLLILKEENEILENLRNDFYKRYECKCM